MNRTFCALGLVKKMTIFFSLHLKFQLNAKINASSNLYKRIALGFKIQVASLEKKNEQKFSSLIILAEEKD